MTKCDDEDWEGLKLTPIREEEDGSNNYSEFKLRAKLDLAAAGYWRSEYLPSADKNALALIVPASKLYIVRVARLVNPFSLGCTSSSRCSRFSVKRIQCGGARSWCSSTINLMPDTQFAKYLVMLMPRSDAWRYCRDSLRARVYEGERTYRLRMFFSVCR